MTDRLINVTRSIAVLIWLIVGATYTAMPVAANGGNCIDHCPSCSSNCDWCGQMPDGFICYQARP